MTSDNYAMVHAKEVDVSWSNITRKDSYSNHLQEVGLFFYIKTMNLGTFEML